MNANYLVRLSSSVSLPSQLEISCVCSLTVNSVFFSCMGLESMAPHLSNFYVFGPRLNVIEDPCSRGKVTRREE